MLALPLIIIIVVVAETQIEEMTTTITNPDTADLVMCKSKHLSNCKVSCNSMKRKVFKSDRGALSAKDERETLLTTRSSSEKLLFSVVLTSGVVESVIELFIRSLTS